VRSKTGKHISKRGLFRRSPKRADKSAFSSSGSEVDRTRILSQVLCHWRMAEKLAITENWLQTNGLGLGLWDPGCEMETDPLPSVGVQYLAH